MVLAKVVKNRAQDKITRKVNNFLINLLMMIRRSKILSAWWSSITWICIIQSMLSEKSGIVLLHPTRPKSRTFCQFHSSSVFSFCLSFNRWRRPLQISSHISTYWSLSCSRLGLINWCWCLK